MIWKQVYRCSVQKQIFPRLVESEDVEHSDIEGWGYWEYFQRKGKREEGLGKQTLNSDVDQFASESK